MQVLAFLASRIVEHPSHNNVPLDQLVPLDNDFALLELTSPIDLTATRFVNSACLASISPFLGNDIVRSNIIIFGWV